MLTLILASGIQQIISFIKHYKVFDPCNWSQNSIWVKLKNTEKP